MTQERRKARRCPGCGGGNIGRGHQVEGVSIVLAPAEPESPAVTAPAYSDVCRDCGMVLLFVRLGLPAEERF